MEGRRRVSEKKAREMKGEEREKNDEQISCEIFMRSALLEMGTMRHLKGAMEEGRERTCRFG